MMIFKYEGENKLIDEATKIANAIFPQVLRRLEDAEGTIVNSNNRASMSTRDLADEMLNYVDEMEVHTYYYRNKNVLGMFMPKYPNRIYINENSIPRSVYSIVATLYHELIHFIDRSSSYDLGHGFGVTANKYKAWKERTAPFYVDNIAEQVARTYLGGVIIDRPNNIMIEVAPLWRRILSRLAFWR